MYGGIERIVHWITEEMVARGHEVTLFATGDSKTSAKLVPMCPRGLRLEPELGVDRVGFHYVMLEEVVKQADQFDIVHFHCDYWQLPYLRLMNTPAVTTTHSRLDYSPLANIYGAFS